MFLAKFAMAMVGMEPDGEELVPDRAKLVTEEYLKKQQWKYRSIRSSRNPCDNQFRAFVDLLSLCAATEYLTDGPSSRAPDAHPGTPCSFPGNWDFEYDGNKFYWRDVHHKCGSAVLWSSETADHIVIAVKEKRNSGIAANHCMFRTQGTYFKGTYIQPEIYQEAANVYESLESTGFLGIVRPWKKNNNASSYEKDTRQNFGFVLTGHKTAGAVATVLGMILKEQGYIVREVVTFGMPKFINERAAANWEFRLRLIRVVNEGDITHQTPVSIFKSPFSENWAHFGREIMLKKNGSHTDEESNGVNDSLIHQLLLRGFGPVFDYWWTNGSAGELHHPILYFDKNYLGHPTTDDFTDALLFCLYRMQTSKKLRNHRHFRVAHKQSSGKRKPNLLYLSVVVFFHIILQIVQSLVGFYTPVRVEDDEAEPLSPISPSLTKNVNFKRVNATTAYTWIYQDNILHGNAASPSTQLVGAKSPAESLNEAIDLHDSGIRCANCVLFRREKFTKKGYGALVIRNTVIKSKAVSGTKKSSKKSAKSAPASFSKSVEKETKEILKHAKELKEKVLNLDVSKPSLPAQRNTEQQQSRQNIESMN